MEETMIADEKADRWKLESERGHPKRRLMATHRLVSFGRTPLPSVVRDNLQNGLTPQPETPTEVKEVNASLPGATASRQPDLRPSRAAHREVGQTPSKDTKRSGFLLLIPIILTMLLVGFLALFSRKDDVLRNVSRFPEPVLAVVPLTEQTRNVNVRSGPAFTYPSIEVVTSGYKVTEIGRAFDQEGKPWIAIRVGNTYGFVKERLLTRP